MNYCANCLGYDYCSARRMCINPTFGYCTRYQPKSWYETKMDESKEQTKERREDGKRDNS